MTYLILLGDVIKQFTAFRKLHDDVKLCRCVNIIVNIDDMWVHKSVFQDLDFTLKFIKNS